MAAKPKQQRLILALLTLAALGGAGVLAASALGETSTYFYAPTDVAGDRPVEGRSIRLGGLVKQGSVSRSGDGLTLKFTVTDTVHETRVRYTGLVPDLFRENQGVVATGSFVADGSFRAKELLARHDENYMPPEVASALERSRKQTGAANPPAA